MSIVNSTTPQFAPRLALFVLSLAQFLIALDYSIIYVALPDISDGLSLNPSLSQWIVTAYGLLFSGFLLVGGRACDRFGSNYIFGRAMIGFGAASFLGAISTNGSLLLLARALQGISAAALQPAIISLISQNFTAEKERASALSIWGAVGASGLVAGVVLGGFLTSLSWRWIFVVNLPIAALSVYLGFRHFRRENAKADVMAMPLFASVLGTSAILMLVLTLSLMAEPDANYKYIAYSGTAAFILITAFLISEKMNPHPLINHELRRIESLRVGCITIAMYMASVGAEFFLVTLVLQKVYGFSVLSAGILFLPLSMTIILGNVIAGHLIKNRAASRVCSFGFVLAALGLAYIGVFVSWHNYWLALLPGLLLSGVGHGIIYTSQFVVGTRDIPEIQQGAASSLMITAQYGSGSIALALLVIILQNSTVSTAYQKAFALTVLFAVLGALIVLLDSQTKRMTK